MDSRMHCWNWPAWGLGRASRYTASAIAYPDPTSSLTSIMTLLRIPRALLGMFICSFKLHMALPDLMLAAGGSTSSQCHPIHRWHVCPLPILGPTPSRSLTSTPHRLLRSCYPPVLYIRWIGLDYHCKNFLCNKQYRITAKASSHGKVTVVIWGGGPMGMCWFTI